jgi:chromosome segregation ATPase
MELLMNNELL